MRVVIAEDLALLRDGLVRLLRDSGFEVARWRMAMPSSPRSRPNGPRSR